MIDQTDPAILREALTAIEPQGRFVPVRALRRVIRYVAADREFHARTIHERAYWVSRDQLFQILTPEELGLDVNESAKDLLLLPEPKQPSLVTLWRDLFHDAVDRRVNDLLRSGHVAARSVRLALGPARWESLRQVLEEESLIGRNADDAEVLRELIAFGLELRYFQPDDWESFFPGLKLDAEPLRPVWSSIDPDQIADSTRPKWVSPPNSRPDVSDAPRSIADSHGSAGAENVTEPDGELRNRVKVAIHRYRAKDPSAAEHLDPLADRLASLTGGSTGAWRTAVRELLPVAASGGWPPERRLLYDLQRACLALDRPAYSVDLVEWAVTFGRRPIKRPLPRTRWVNALRRLRAAFNFAERLASPPPGLAHLLGEAIRIAERSARDDLRPHLVDVLDEVGLVPRSEAEQRSREKLVEELLDGACQKGFLRIGDLRDAIARNRVKLEDLSGPGEFFQGDALLRANHRLPERLDGVYHRGEFYMRLLQRTCSIFFGTRTGSWLTRYIALPFGGSYLILEGLHHMYEAGEGLVEWISGHSAMVEGVSALGGGMAGTLADNPTLEKSGIGWPSFLGLAFFLLLLLHWPAFRRHAVKAARFVFQKLPAAIRRSSIIRMFVDNFFTRFLGRYVLVPILVGALAGGAHYLVVRDGFSAGLLGSGVALFTGAFFRTPLGRRLEDRVDEAAARVWRVVTVNFIVGLITLVMQVFHDMLEAFDRAIYAVDEWLRFREGEGRFSFAFKLLFGTGWFLVTYLFRFAWTLMVEPQINPIKHFPVVTVSHKLLLPLIPSLAKEFGVSEKTMGSIIFGIPGVFGFLVWELKENWKLYRANASPNLRAVIVGSHGEKVRGLLRPGFHSGVVPKTFAKLRKAVRQAAPGRAARAHHVLEHVADAVHRFVQRDFVSTLHASKRWGGILLKAKSPVLTPNQIVLPMWVNDAFEVNIRFEERGGWVIASTQGGEQLASLEAGARAAFTDALIGLYKRAGVDLIREQVAAIYGAQAYPFDAVAEGLWIPTPEGRVEFFDYDDGLEVLQPEHVLPKVIVFSDCPLPWTDWADRWDADAAGKNPQSPLLPNWTLLPAAG